MLAHINFLSYLCPCQTKTIGDLIMENTIYKYSFKCEKMNDVTMPYNAAIKTDADAVTLLRGIFWKENFSIILQEYIVVVFLNKANVPIGYYKASEGGTSSSVFDIKIL